MCVIKSKQQQKKKLLQCKMFISHTIKYELYICTGKKIYILNNLYRYILLCRGRVENSWEKEENYKIKSI